MRPVCSTRLLVYGFVLLLFFGRGASKSWGLRFSAAALQADSTQRVCGAHAQHQPASGMSLSSAAYTHRTSIDSSHDTSNSLNVAAVLYPVARMNKASAYGSGDCRFEPFIWMRQHHTQGCLWQHRSTTAVVWPLDDGLCFVAQRHHQHDSDRTMLTGNSKYSLLPTTTTTNS